MFCPYCGAKCHDNHNFCYQCGSALPRSEEIVEFVSKIPAEDAVEVNTPPAELTDPAPEKPPESNTAPAATTEPVLNDSEKPEDSSDVREAPAEPELPKPKKGRLWPPVLLLVLMFTAGLALFLFSGHNSYFSVENGALSFHPEYYTGGPELTIPETVDGQTVTSIADYAFRGCDGITAIIIPSTVTKIGEYAFSDCDDLRGIYIPSSVKKVDNYAFFGCDSLEAIYLPGSLQKLGTGALESCGGLKYILFNGTYWEWAELYDGYFTTNVELHTTDGTYYSKP